MKVIICIQRYGTEIVGGGESFTRSVAEGLAAKGHTIEVVTTTAIDYQTWAPSYAAGTENINGVVVHRFDALTRDKDQFEYLIERAHGAAVLGQPLPTHIEEEWLRVVGPWMPELEGWLDDNLGRFDVALGVTYQYAHILSFTNAVARSGTPYAMAPLAHYDVTLSLDVFEPIISLPDAFLYLTEEERILVEQRMPASFKKKRSAVLGCPVPLADKIAAGEARALSATEGGVHANQLANPLSFANRMRAYVRLRTRRDPAQRFMPGTYIVAVGRLDPSKGFKQLTRDWRKIRWFRRTFPRLVIVGSGDVKMLPIGVSLTGFVDDATLDTLLRNAIALVHPSSFESFSIVCCEAWLREIPIVVTGDCDVLVGQSQRSGGGLWYDSIAELALIVEKLCDDLPLRRQLGMAGAQYVMNNYTTDKVVSGFEAELQHLASSREWSADQQWVSPQP